MPLIKNEKVSNLPSNITDINNFYTVGVQNNTTRKLNLGVFPDKVAKLVSVAKIPDTFNPANSYNINDCVVYDSSMWRFTAAHSGEWTGTDVVSATGYIVVDGVYKKPTHIHVSSKDASFDCEGIKVTATPKATDIPLVATPDTLVSYTDASGNCDMILDCDVYYTIEGEHIDGYSDIEKVNILGFQNEYDNEIYLRYSKLYTDGSVTIRFTLDDEGSLTPFNGKYAYGFFESISCARFNTVADASTVISCPRKVNGELAFPTITYYDTPASYPINFDTPTLSYTALYKHSHVPKPTITRDSNNLITITNSFTDTVSYYTTDETIPTTSSILYTEPFTSTARVMAISTKTGYLDSYVNGVQVPKPTITRDSDNLITITDDWTDALIYYTTDCSTPTTSSNLYSNPFTSEESIKAIAVKTNYLNSEMSINIGGIPSIYTQLQYLQSNGSQYIDTSIVANAYPLNIQAEIMHTSFSGERDFFGNYNGSVGFVYGASGSNTYFWTNNSWTPVGLQANTQYIFNATVNSASSTKTLVLNGTSYSVSQISRLTESAYTIGMFSGRGNNLYCGVMGRIYHADIYVGGTLKGSFYPVLRTSDSKPGMFDFVTGHFFVNKGSGEFTYA